jgi:hypothetical protein
MAEQQPTHFSPEHVQELQWQAKPNSLQPNPADLPRSNTPLVDAFIDRAAKEMAKSNWRGLMETEPSEEVIQRVRELTKNNG